MRVALRKTLSGTSSLTVIFCYNDELAVWLRDEGRKLGLRVPEDVSIVSFDDSVLSVTTRPRLTTIHSPLAELAAVAVELLCAQIQGKPSPVDPTFISPILVERESTRLLP